MRLFHIVALCLVLGLTGAAYGFMTGRHLAPANAVETDLAPALSRSIIVPAGQFVVPVAGPGGGFDALLLAEINLAVPPESKGNRTLALSRPVLRHALLEGLFDLSAKGRFAKGSVSPKDLGDDLKRHLETVYQDTVPITAVLFDRLLLQEPSSGPL